MSTAEVTRLANGIRIASETLPHVDTVSLGVWIGVGARHETTSQHGLSHFLEHMAFKGTAKRSAQRIAEEIEDVGGDINAATGLDSTAYYVRVLKGDEALGLEILADILLNSTFADDELAKERDVILQEIAAADDSPDDLAYDVLSAVAFPNQAIGRPILGTAKSVSQFSAKDMRDYLSAYYQPDDIVISAAGAIHHENLVRHVEALFGGLTQSVKPSADAAVYSGGVGFSPKPFEQSHVLLGWPSPANTHGDYFAAQVFSGLLGGGMSSRLFQEIRERRGLCYSIYTSAWGMRDAGMLTVHAATGKAMVDELSDVTSHEVRSVANAGPTAPELQRSKAQLKAGLLMSLESSSVRAEQMARQLLNHGRLINVKELVDRVDAVSVEDVRRVATDMTAAPASVVVVGSGRGSRAQADRAAKRLADAASAMPTVKHASRVATKGAV